jgi:MoaA/NifB/PqqE/SkfB family radical SAM enzyme
MSFKDIELDRAEDFKLESLEIGLTSVCNFACDYCNVVLGKSLLPAETIIDKIKDLEHLKRVKLSGGEVTVHLDECIKVIEFCSSRGIKVQINTNGTLLDAGKIRVLEDVGLDCLHVSLDAYNASDFARYYRKAEKFFHKVIDTIQLSAQSRQITTVVETIMFKETVDKAVKIADCIYETGARHHEVQYGVYVPHTRWNETISKEALQDVMVELVIHKKPDMNMYFSCLPFDKMDFYKRIDGKQDNVFFPSCIEGKKQLHLHHDGSVMICELGHPMILGNVFQGLDLNRMYDSVPRDLLSFTACGTCRKDQEYPAFLRSLGASAMRVKNV